MTTRGTELIRSTESVPAADPAAEIGADLHHTLNRYTEWAVKGYRDTLAHIEKKQAGYVPPGERDDLAVLREQLRSAVDALDRVGKERHPFRDDRAPEDVSWHDLTDGVARDGDAGMALWGKVKQAAAAELASGRRGAGAVEPYWSSPWQRAQYLALRAALADGLHPRNGMESLLLDNMAQAMTMHLQWLSKHAKTESLDAMRVGKDARDHGEWQPPRLSDAEAVDRAAMMADRFLRSFLRLMKTYRDGRKILQSFTMLGGQLNVAGDGGQQVIATRMIRSTPSLHRTRPEPTQRRFRRRDGQD